MKFWCYWRAPAPDPYTEYNKDWILRQNGLIVGNWRNKNKHHKYQVFPRVFQVRFAKNVSLGSEISENEILKTESLENKSPTNEIQKTEISKSDKSNCVLIQGFPVENGVKQGRKEIDREIKRLTLNNWKKSVEISPREIVQPKDVNSKTAFVYFDDHEQAVVARDALDGLFYKGHYKLRTSLAKVSWWLRRI